MKILLVEDDRKLSRALARMLEDYGHEVEVAFDGERGAELGMQGGFDAIILDWMMPLMDGIEVCRMLRDNRVEVPILMLTARSAVGDRVEGLYAGADDYLTKPFAFQELLARLRAITRRAADAHQGDHLEVDGLVLDVRRRRVEYGGLTMDLSPREFSVLEVLMRNEGQVIAQSQMLDHVWGYESWPESNLVPVYVTYLRRKFKELDIPLNIKAIRGVGYTLSN